jgi:RNA polymerase sigma factor (sigma-70 family)
MEFLVDVAGHCPDVSERISVDERNLLVKTAMGELKEEDRLLLEEFYFKEMSWQSIAKRRDLSKSAFNSRLKRARDRLQAILENNQAFKEISNPYSSGNGGLF